MTIVVADTSGLLAIADRSDPHHAATADAAEHAGALVVSPLALAETDHLARGLGKGGRAALLGGIIEEAAAARVLVPAVTVDHLATAMSVMQQYADLDLDLTDAVTVALAAQYATNTILTLDRRDFRTITPLTAHRHFRLLPDDL